MVLQPRYLANHCATDMAGESVEEAVVEEDKAGKVEAKHVEMNPVED